MLLGLALPAHCFSQQQAAPDPAERVLAGRIELVEGGVRLLDTQRQPRVPKLDDPVYEGDSIVTAADGELHVKLEDEGFIAVRPGTKMRVTAFRAQGDDQDKVLIGLLEGSFRAVTGWIAKFNSANYTIRTPNASIGIRGTDHEPFQIPQGSPLGEPGTYDKVNDGATFIQSKLGRIDVDAGRSGHAHPRIVPRLLERHPAFYRPTRNEERITRRYQEVQQQLRQKRDERRKLIEQRRGKPEQKGGQLEQKRSKLEEKREARQQKLEEHRREKAEKAAQREQRLHEKAEKAGKQREQHEQRLREKAGKQRE